jgi:hypothetical protein
MFTFFYYSLIILNYLLFANSIKIGQIQNARIINSTSTFETNCSTCICQCIKYLSSSSSCCYVNCYRDNNTCQLIISPSTINPVMIMDKTSIVYKTNCLNSSSRTYPTNNGENLLIKNPRAITDVTATTLANTASVPSKLYSVPW